MWTGIGKAILAISAAASAASASRLANVQFAKSGNGRMVSVAIDGRVESTFAGKMTYRDQTSSWQSLCCDVRTPVREGQIYNVQLFDTAKLGGNIAKAGNIVAIFFRYARSAEQCAGLQLAVWEAIEDGGAEPDFTDGRFSARAPAQVLSYAAQYYRAADVSGHARMMYSPTTQSQIAPLPRP